MADDLVFAQPYCGTCGDAVGEKIRLPHGKTITAVCERHMDPVETVPERDERRFVRYRVNEVMTSTATVVIGGDQAVGYDQYILGMGVVLTRHHGPDEWVMIERFENPIREVEPEPVEDRLARAEALIEALRHTGGLPIDRIWARWRELFQAYDNGETVE